MPLKPKHDRMDRTGHTCGGQRCGKPGCRGAVASTVRTAIEGAVEPARATSMPGPVKRAARYSTAVARWIAAGRPTRSQDEIDALLAICHACDDFDAEARACRRCGCNINSQASGLKNKLAMATEKCPVGKW